LFSKNKVNKKSEEFYEILDKQFKTFVGPEHWFEMDKKFMKIGYGWPTTHRIELKKRFNNTTSVIKIGCGCGWMRIGYNTHTHTHTPFRFSRPTTLWSRLYLFVYSL